MGVLGYFGRTHAAPIVYLWPPPCLTLPCLQQQAKQDAHAPPRPGCARRRADERVARLALPRYRQGVTTDYNYVAWLHAEHAIHGEEREASRRVSHERG